MVSALEALLDVLEEHPAVVSVRAAVHPSANNFFRFFFILILIFVLDGRCISLPCRSRVKNVSGKKILFGLAPRAVMKDFTENVSRN